MDAEFQCIKMQAEAFEHAYAKKDEQIDQFFAKLRKHFEEALSQLREKVLSKLKIDATEAINVESLSKLKEEYETKKKVLF